MAEQPIDEVSIKDGRILTRLWDWKDITPILFVSIFLLIILSLVATFLAGAQIDFTDGTVDGADPFLLLLYSLGATLLAFLIPYFGMNAIRKRHSLAKLGLGAMPEGWVWPSIGLGVAGALVRMAIGAGLLLLFPALEEGAEELAEMFAFEQTWQMLVIGLAASLIVPVYEEIFFRGLIHNGIGNRLGVWGTIIASSALFGLFHGFPIQIITAFLFGLIVGWLYEKTNSLWPAIICHVTNNALAMGLSIVSIWVTEGL
ncbi:MAG: lysostaphin resistance A-like protein [Anaerolineae bacterium]